MHKQYLLASDVFVQLDILGQKNSRIHIHKCRHEEKAIQVCMSRVLLINKNINSPRDNVLTGTDNCDQALLEFLMSPLHIRALVHHMELLKLAEDIVDLEALFEIVVLV